MNKNKIEILGTLSGFLTTVAFIPQAIKTWGQCPKPADSISLPMFVILCVGTAGWTTYGFLIKSFSVKFANIATFFLAISILIYKIIYG